MTVSAEQLSNTEFLLSHSAPHRLSDPSPEHLLFFEVLLKEAAALMSKVQKHQSAANNIKSPTNLAQILESNGTLFKSLMLQKDRPIKVVIRGLPGHTPVEDIEAELRALEFPLIKIARMSKFRTRETMPLLYVQLSPSSKTEEIYSLSTLLALSV
ncbi:hypothetical protein CDAR_409681 [Caerostris darwini]|uniref:Pre-C2HC domain-containing protein n=1 Tax=Caerostris darwini TaxID=1538125 RepID=A0AAV4SGJ2_9ARAC|nr:hypothetical protein CDAR_409681 [Caerostris darwini]